MNEATLEAPAPHDDVKIATLTAQDRCDECGAQAYGVALYGESELLFCAHHFTKHEAKLALTATKLIDERWRLTDKRPESSA